MPGDLVFFDWTGAGKPHHVGIVRAAFPNGSLQTVEGNTSSRIAGSQSDGDGVFVRIRTRLHIFGFIRLE